MSGVSFVQRIKKKYVKSCAVSGCESNSKKHLSLCFHGFPKPNERVVYTENLFGKLEKIDKLKAWQRATKVENITERKKVCSLHFTKQDYILPDIQSKKRTLKKTAIPSCNLPSTYKNVERDNARLQRRLKRANTSETDIDSQLQGKCSAALGSEGVPEPADFTNDEKELSSPEYILPDIPPKKRTLEKISIPSCNLSSTSKNVQRDNAQLQRRSKRVNTSESNIDPQSEGKCSAALGSEDVLEPADFTNDEKELSSPIDPLMTIKEEHERKENIPPTTDIGVQVKSEEERE